MFVNINASFLEDDHMISNKVRSEVDLKTLNEIPTKAHNTIDPIPIIPISSTSMPHGSVMVVVQPYQFMYLRFFRCHPRRT